MNLFKTELRRLGKRRFTRYTALLGVLLLLGIAVFTFVSNEKVGPAQIAEAKQAAEQHYQHELKWSEQRKQECERVHQSGTTEEKQHFPSDCEVIQPPPREAFSYEWHLPSTFEFRAEFGYTVTAFAAILALIAFVIGASFVGAEWNTGGMMTLLLWRPQRLRVLLTKLGALLTGLLAFTVAGAVGWTAAFWSIGTFRGSMEKMTSGAWQSFALMGLRGTVLVLVAGLLGFALASLGRHTAMALGGAMAVAVVGQFGVGVVLAMANVKFMEAWLLPTYVLAWLQQKVTLTDWNSCNFTYTGECEAKTMDIVWQDSAVLFSVTVVLALGTALWAMRRRDISG